MGGGIAHQCDACPVGCEKEDQTGEDDTSGDFAGFIRNAMHSFGMDADAWLEEQDVLARERAAEA